MTENPYYRLLALIRAQQGAAPPQCFTARLQQLSPPVFTAGDTEFSPTLATAGMTLSESQLGQDFLCLWLEGRGILLCGLEEVSWR